jgi:glycosyltransferase involved in cell wall biosynthesis
VSTLVGAARPILADADLWPAVCVVGPLPPPSGGMANQCEQLVRLLRDEGVEAELVCTNASYRPAWAGRLPVLRAGFRLLPYLLRLWQAAGRAQVMHVLANSGWSWHLCAAPALLIARLRGTPVIINYRGGNADAFFASAPRHVLRMLAGASLRVTPSKFLFRVFSRYGLSAEVVPNIIDLSRFVPGRTRMFGDAPHLVVTRNLEPIYDIPTAIRAFARIRDGFQCARLTIAGTGPELSRLEALVADLGLQTAVSFTGRIANADIPALYASADCLLNPSTVDNMPVSILEAFASGVPVVSTCAGGIPDLVEQGVSGLLVPVGDHATMATEALRVLRDAGLAAALRQAGLEQAHSYAWPRVRRQWLDAYRRVAAERRES